MERENYTSNNKNQKRNVKPLIQMKIEIPKQSNIQSKTKDDILTVLIYIYYYEKNVLNNKKAINFNNKEKYYLIKSQWIKELKEYYEYQKISKSLYKFGLENKKESNISINLDTLSDNNLLEKIKLYLNNSIVNLLNKQTNKNLKNSKINNLPRKNKNNFIYYLNGYIINSTILEIFEKYMFEGKNISIKPISIFNKEYNIFLSLINNPFVFVTIGNLNNELIFVGNSCLCYYNLKTFEDEKKILLNKSLKDYIISRKCQENGSNSQTLKKEIKRNFYNIGLFLRIPLTNIIRLNTNKPIGKRPTSTKVEVKNKWIEKSTESYNSTQNKSEKSLKKNNFGNNLNIRRSQTPQNMIKSQINLNNNNQKNSTILSTIQEEYNKFPKNTYPNFQNKVNNNEDINQNEQVKLLQNELKKNKQIIEQLSEEKRKLMEKDRKNQEQIKRLNSFNNDREKEKDEKNKNILDEKEIKIRELEKEVLRLNSLLNKQSDNESNILKNENLNRDIQIKMPKIEIDNKDKNKENELANKIKENIKLKKYNEKLKKESNQKDAEIQKLKNENKINMEEKEKENKKIKEILDNLQNEYQYLKNNNGKESQNKINSMIDEQKKRDDKINVLTKKNQAIQKELQDQKNFNNKLKEKEEGQSKMIFELQNQLNEKDKKINSLNEENKILKSQINNENQKKANLDYFEKEYTKNIELSEKLKQISEKENEINKKISFLEDKENMLEKENKEFIENKNKYEELQKEIINLKNENKKLQAQLSQSKGNNNEKNKFLLNSIQSNEINDYIESNKQSQNKLQNQSQNQDSQIINPNPIPNPNSKPLPPIENTLKNYKEPTLIGLNNIGATCFMNSTLQCLSQTASLTNYFLKDSKKKRIIENNIWKQNKNLPQLTPIYLELIKKLWDKNKKGSSFSPNKFMETVEKMNPLFKKGQAGDSKDFIIFILEQIHKELKRPINSQTNSNIQLLDQYDKKKAFANFMNDFSKECSIISDIFFGFTETTNVCLYCKNFFNSQGKNNPICYNYGIFNCLIFPLEEVKNFRNNYLANLNIQINQNNSVTLNECFFYNQKTEMFNGENRSNCNICKQLFDSEYTSRIYSSPNVLILILNRGKDNKYNIKLDFTETFDLTQFVVVKDRPQLIYNLNGVITHFGQSGPNAHFIGFCKSPINNKWYKYNDAFVNLVENVQKEIINFGTPYILFYQKSN